MITNGERKIYTKAKQTNGNNNSEKSALFTF